MKGFRPLGPYPFLLLSSDLFGSFHPSLGRPYSPFRFVHTVNDHHRGGRGTPNTLGDPWSSVVFDSQKHRFDCTRFVSSGSKSDSMWVRANPFFECPYLFVGD